MPNLDQIIQHTAELERVKLTIPLGDDDQMVIKAVLDFSKITPLTMAQIDPETATNRAPLAIAGAICEVVVEWDLKMGDPEVPVPLDVETLGRIPTIALMLILEAIEGAVAVNPTSSGTGNGTSRAAARSARSRRGVGS